MQRDFWGATFRTWVWILVGCIAVHALCVALNGITGLAPGWLSGDGEVSLRAPFALNIPALLSGAVLVIAGRAWIDVGRESTGFNRISAWVFGIFMMFMAFDELVTLHESLEAWTGVMWQLLYLPVMAVAAVAASAIVITLVRSDLSQISWLLILGSLAWVIAQMLKPLEWPAPGQQRVGYAAYMFVEEVLEISGSSLFALAGILTLAVGLLPAGRLFRSHARHAARRAV